MRHLIRLGLPLLLVAGAGQAQPAAPVGDLPVPPHALPAQPLEATPEPSTPLQGSAVGDAGQGKAGAADNATQPAPRSAHALHARTGPKPARPARAPR